MKIKKIYRKIICTVLAGLLPVSVSLPVFAADNTMLEGDISQDIEILYGQDSAYMVTVPKKIILGMDRKATYAIKVSGDLRSDQYVRVVPVDEIPETDIVDFYMKDQNGKKEDVVATVMQNKICWNFDDAANAYEEANNLVSAPGLTAGTWKGTLQLDIILETEETHVHDYVNGKCVCGAVDPEHTHIYENGTCTVCGEAGNNMEAVGSVKMSTEMKNGHDTDQSIDQSTDQSMEHTHDYINGKCECGEMDPSLFSQETEQE